MFEKARSDASVALDKPGQIAADPVVRRRREVIR
jgi:hypothetical protein